MEGDRQRLCVSAHGCWRSPRQHRTSSQDQGGLMEGKNVYVIVGTDGYPIPYIADDFDDAIEQHRYAEYKAQKLAGMEEGPQE